MKKILPFILLVPFYSYSHCSVYIPVKEFNVAGYVINFDFTEVLSQKKYEEVFSENEANYELTLEGKEIEGRFHKAKTSLKLMDYHRNVIAETEQQVTCLMQFCSLNDYAKSFRKSILNLSKKLPICR